MTKITTIVLPVVCKQHVSYLNTVGGCNINYGLPKEVGKVVQVLQKIPFSWYI